MDVSDPTEHCEEDNHPFENDPIELKPFEDNPCKFLKFDNFGPFTNRFTLEIPLIICFSIYIYSYLMWTLLLALHAIVAQKMIYKT
jgi:hypothetical protein